MRTKKKIITSLISTGKYQELVSDIVDLSIKEEASYVCVSNVHMLIEAYKSKTFNELLNNADIATPDGMPLAKSMKLLYGIKQDRVAGMDLMPDIMNTCEKENLSIFIYGSTAEVLEKIRLKAKEEFPSLKLKMLSPPFRELFEDEKATMIEKINAFNPNFVFVALGCPKQEKWMAEHKDKLNACMVGLGGALEVYAGIKNRAPQWMQDYSLEWLYRLVQDPKRLWKRYLITNTLFVVLLLKQLMKERIFFK